MTPAPPPQINDKQNKEQQHIRKLISNFYCTIYHYFCFVKLASVLDIRNLLTNLHNDVLCIRGRKQSLLAKLKKYIYIFIFNLPLTCSLLFTFKYPGHWHTLK